MKKFIILLLVPFLFVGCTMMKSTPTNTVKAFFTKYQNLENDIEKSLDYMIKKESKMSKKQKEEYKNLLKKQYQNLSYKITNEELENDKAEVDVDIEVLNYLNAKARAKQKTLETKNKDFINQQLKEMQEVNDKIIYHMKLYLEKEDGIWNIKNLTDDDLEKIHGIFGY